MPLDLKPRMHNTVFAFRGYNISNQGRSAELLAHPKFGPVVEQMLREAGEVCADLTHQPCDLVARVRQSQPSILETYAQDLAQIVALNLAQIRLLEEFYDVPFTTASMTIGYSLGEIAALAAGGVFRMSDLLVPVLSMARDCAELADDVTLGVLFSRGAELDLSAVERLCLELTIEDRGIIAVSTYLSPNSVLLMGEGSTVRRFAERMPHVLGEGVYLRENRHRWPPLHTPILWRRNIPNRAGLLMLRMAGGLTAPRPRVLSLVTGRPEYTDHNARELLVRWIDHPQRLWDAVQATLSSGTEVVVHVGPEPNLIPATFRRLAFNVAAQLNARTWSALGLRAMRRIWRPWLAKWLSTRSALLRAPFVEHVTLEDWLLDPGPRTINPPLRT
jgi:[acyl-carrier-protein] S-malonyltransferase